MYQIKIEETVKSQHHPLTALLTLLLNLVPELPESEVFGG